MQYLRELHEMVAYGRYLHERLKINIRLTKVEDSPRSKYDGF
jgi:hypothetical protein